MGEICRMHGGNENCIQEFGLKSEEIGIIWRSRCEKEDIIKVYLKERVGYGPVDWLHMALAMYCVHSNEFSGCNKGGYF